MAIDYGLLKRIRQKFNYTHADMAGILGLTPRVYRSYEYGEREMPTTVMKALCLTFNVSADELLGMAHAAPEVRNDIKIINGKIIYMTPIYELNSDYDSEPIERMPEYFDSLKQAKATIAIKVSGDECYPKIEDGDLVIVNKLEHGRHGDLVLAKSNGTNIIKRIIKTREKDKLESINPIFPPIDITGDKAELVKILGVVKKIIKVL